MTPFWQQFECFGTFIDELIVKKSTDYVVNLRASCVRGLDFKPQASQT